MQSKNTTKMCNALKKEYTRFYSFWGSFNPVSAERFRSRVFAATGIPLASSPISAKMEGILVSHQSTFPCKLSCARGGRRDGEEERERENQLRLAGLVDDLANSVNSLRPQSFTGIFYLIL